MSSRGDQYEGMPPPSEPHPTQARRPGDRRPARCAALSVAVVVLIAATAIATIAHGTPTASRSVSSLHAGSPIAAEIDPALVDISVIFGYGGGKGAATGIVISPDGEVLTNNHVIDGATTITATDVGNRRSYTATVVGYAPSIDIAVLRLQGASGLATVKLGDSSKVGVGDAVLGIGNARGAGGAPVTARGTVAALDQSLLAGDGSVVDTESLAGLIAVNGNIQPGDSGGPLVDSGGAVIGVETAGSSAGLNSSRSYAVPINQAISTARKIESGRGSATIHVGRSAFLGVLVSAASSSSPAPVGGSSSPAPGLPVASVVSGGPAATSGLGPGDVITSLAGRTVRSTEDLRAIMLVHHPDDRVKLVWIDTAGRSQSSTVVLGSGPPT